MSDLFAIKCQLDRIERKLDLNSTQKWFDMKAACNFCKLSPSSLYRGIRSGRLKCSRSQGKLMFQYIWLDHFLNG